MIQELLQQIVALLTAILMAVAPAVSSFQTIGEVTSEPSDLMLAGDYEVMPLVLVPAWTILPVTVDVSYYRSSGTLITSGSGSGRAFYTSRVVGSTLTAPFTVRGTLTLDTVYQNVKSLSIPFSFSYGSTGTQYPDVFFYDTASFQVNSQSYSFDYKFTCNGVVVSGTVQRSANASWQNNETFLEFNFPSVQSEVSTFDFEIVLNTSFSGSGSAADGPYFYTSEDSKVDVEYGPVPSVPDKDSSTGGVTPSTKPDYFDQDGNWSSSGVQDSIQQGQAGNLAGYQDSFQSGGEGSTNSNGTSSAVTPSDEQKMADFSQNAQDMFGSSGNADDVFSWASDSSLFSWFSQGVADDLNGNGTRSMADDDYFYDWLRPPDPSMISDDGFIYPEKWRPDK